MSAPNGAIVSIYYDGQPVYVNQCLQTPTGRTYVVTARRVQLRGKHKGRQHLACLVAAAPPPGAFVRPLHWYKRG